MKPDLLNIDPLDEVINQAGMLPEGREPVSSLDDVIAYDATPRPLASLDDVINDAPLDKKAFLAQERRRMLGNVTSEYGHVGFTGQDPNEPRGRSAARGFFETLISPGVGKNTVSDVRNVINALGDERAVMNDADILLNDLRNLGIKYPDIMASPEGEAFAKDIELRVSTALDQDPAGAWELINQIADFGYNDPNGLSELILDETIFNPLLPLLAWGGYRIGGVAGKQVGKALNLTKMLNRLRMGTARQRLAAVTATSVMNIGKFGTAEAGVNAASQVSMNKSTGREAMHNTVTVAQIGLALGVTAGMLRGAHKIITGGAGIRKSATSAAESQGYRNFEHMMDDLMVKSGWEPTDVVKLFKENMKNNLPFSETVSHVMKYKVNKLAGETPASTPRAPRNIKPIDIEAIFGRVKAEIDPQNSWTSKLFEKTGKTEPAGVDSQGNPFYNIKSTMADLDNGLRWLRGLNSDGTRASGTSAQVRHNIFKGWDSDKLTSWAKRKGPKGYQELLQRIEANKLQLKGKGLSDAEITAKAVNKSFEEMGAPPNFFKKLSTPDKIRDAVDATFTRTKNTAQDVIRNPKKLYGPIKDVFVSSSRFVEDIVKGPMEGKGAALRQRQIFSNMLRDWEGNKLAGELDVKNFSDWLRREIPNAEKRTAMSHYLEGDAELSRYNAHRVKKGQEPIDLTPYEKQVASSARKYFDDVLDWAQRSELFTLFRDYPGMFKRAKRQAGDTSVDKRAAVRGKDYHAIRDQEIWDFISGTTDPRGMMWQVSGKTKAMGHYKNYVPHLIKREFAPTENSLFDWSLEDAHAAGQLQTSSKHLRKRSYETMMDAMDAGESLYTRDIAQLVSAYGKSMLRSQVNARLLHQLGKMKNVNGHPMIGKYGDVPDYYVEFKHPNFRDTSAPKTKGQLVKEGHEFKDEYLYVNPNLAPDMRLYFDTSNPGVANRVLQNIVLISKRAALGLSFFHIVALGWSGLVSGQNPMEVVRNVIPSGRLLKSRGLQALSGATARDTNYLEMGMRNGLGIGVLEELRGDTLINGMRSLADFAETTIGSNKYMRPLGKGLGGGLRGLAKAQEVIDSHLWDHVNSGLKATTFLTTMEKMVLQDAKRVESGAQTKLTDLNKISQRAAQFTNDAYGNQNWAQMAMNVENFMGHRIAAALNKPSMRGYIRMLVFAPDWSLSNLRVLGKTVSGAVPIGKKELAHREYAKYAIRSAILFAAVNEILQTTSGQRSIFEESGTDLLYADLGDGKKMQISKQLAEVMSAIINGPMHVAESKMSMPLKAYRDSDSVGEFVGEGLKSSVPISVGQAAQGNFAGSFGVPIYTEGN